MQNANCKLQIDCPAFLNSAWERGRSGLAEQFAFFNLHFSICNLRPRRAVSPHARSVVAQRGRIGSSPDRFSRTASLLRRAAARAAARVRIATRRDKSPYAKSTPSQAAGLYGHLPDGSRRVGGDGRRCNILWDKHLQHPCQESIQPAVASLVVQASRLPVWGQYLRAALRCACWSTTCPFFQ